MGSFPSKARPKKTFAAALAHLQTDAADARYLQFELEKRLERRLFLESDLDDVSQLPQHIQDSECVLLLQTPNVLTRPWCLIELHKAIENNIPIIGVTILGGQHSYDFAAASNFLLHLDS